VASGFLLPNQQAFRIILANLGILWVLNISIKSVFKSLVCLKFF
jgi:hypothetical protein